MTGIWVNLDTKVFPKNLSFEKYIIIKEIPKKVFFKRILGSASTTDGWALWAQLLTCNWEVFPCGIPAILEEQLSVRCADETTLDECYWAYDQLVQAILASSSKLRLTLGCLFGGESAPLVQSLNISNILQSAVSQNQPWLTFDCARFIEGFCCSVGH